MRLQCRHPVQVCSLKDRIQETHVVLVLCMCTETPHNPALMKVTL